MARPVTNILDRFWKLVDVKGEDECWEWLGHLSPYGSFFIRNTNHVPAHKFSWELYNEKEVPNGLQVLHKCDNPPCVNPKHLFIGTPLDNMQDKIQKGRDRYKPCIGERNGKHKLYDQDVLDIREKYKNGMSCIDISKEYQIHRVHATRIVFGRRRLYV